MKTTLIALAAALAFSAVPAAQAQEPVSQNVQKVKISGRGYVTNEQFLEYANTYRLSNGQKIQFTQSGNHFFTQVDNGRRVRLLPVSSTEFVTEQGAQIVFREFGDEIGINNFEKLPMAQVLPANTMVVARR